MPMQWAGPGASDTIGGQGSEAVVRTAIVVGAGVFGAWIAHAMTRRGWRVTLVEQYGPGNARASSGGETRIIRSGYGDEALYARWARASLADWIALELRVREPLFVKTGALFIGRTEDWVSRTAGTLEREQIACERIDGATLAGRFPQLRFPETCAAVFEPDAGVLFARRAVQALVRTLADDGVRIVTQRADPQQLIRDARADAIIFAAGPWLPTLFPDALGDAVRPTRQEVFFFGAPPAATQYGPGRLPAWVAFEDGVYGLPDLEHRGVKVAIDAHGPPADPDTMDRSVSEGALARMREVVGRLLPGLAGAPLLEARVCQYENTTNGHLLLDLLPGHDHVWIAGGGSGHGFKHGPMIGAYLADLLDEQRAPEPLFQLEGRPPRARAVF